MEDKLELIKALIEFQRECPIIYKSTQGYGYKYADMSQIISTIQPLLTKNDLCISYDIENTTENNIVVTCNLIHKTGAFFKNTLQEKVFLMKGQNELQCKGSVITYLRRYTLSALLNLVTDVDLDGADSKEEPNNVPQNNRNSQPAYSNENTTKPVVKKIITSQVNTPQTNVEMQVIEKVKKEKPVIALGDDKKIATVVEYILKNPELNYKKVIGGYVISQEVLALIHVELALQMAVYFTAKEFDKIDLILTYCNLPDSLTNEYIGMYKSAGEEATNENTTPID